MLGRAIKHTIPLVSIAVVAALVVPVAAQMMPGMGGGRHGAITLVSPADSPTQVRRGVVMVGQYMAGMMGQNPGGSGTPGNPAPGIRIRLRLSGVTDPNGLVASTGNHLIFEGQLTTPTGAKVPIAVDQLFAVTAGSALVQVPLSFASVTGSATITIDRVAVQDSSSHAFAVPGIVLAQPTPQTTPHPTPGGRCTTDSDCNDGNPNNRDVCTPMGCQHMGGHMGPGMSAQEQVAR